MSVVQVDPIYESDGDIGGLMGWLLYPERGSEVTFDDVEAFMAEVDEDFPDGVDGGWEVEDVHVRKVPREWGFVYAYSGPGPGARKATKIEQVHSWGHWCVNHIYEPASTGIPVENVLDPPWPMVVGSGSQAYVYLCRPCSDSFHERQRAATAAALAS